MFALTALKKLSTVALGTSLAIWGFSDSCRAASLYTVTNLVDSYPIQSMGADLNEAGEVTGTYGTSARPTSAFRWSPARGLQFLSPPGGAFYALGNAINDTGTVAGFSLDSIPNTSAVLWDPNGLPQRLPNFDSGDPFAYESIANDINNRGQVVGSGLSTQGTRAALWDNNRIVDLGIAGEATAINEFSEIVGNADNTGGFLWKNGQIVDLGDLSVANDINDRGQVVGTSSCGGSTCASIWDNGTLTQFGANTVAEGINNLGWGVGYSDASSLNGRRALLWKDGRALDLNRAIDPSLGWTLYEATAINDKGQIVGVGKAPDKPWGGVSFSAFLLTPVEEPTSVPESTPLLGLVAIGAGLAFSRRYGR